MRIYARTSYGGVSMGPIGWLLLGPILLPIWMFAGFLRFLTGPRR